jgi:hypothetical protein
VKVLEVDLGYRPRPWQEHFHRGKKKNNILIVHRRAGKTVAARMELVDCGLKIPMSKYAYIAPFLKQARAVVWDELKLIANKIPYTTISETDMQITFANKSSIRLFGADNADAIRGLGFHGAVLDEYADFTPGVYGQVIIPTLAAASGWQLVIGTPKGTDPLSELYNRNKENQNWYARILPYQETGAISADEIARMREVMLPNEFRLEMECDFDAGATDTLITGDWVDMAEKRKVEHDAYRGCAIVMGVDPARFGDDATAIAVRQGAKLLFFRKMKGANVTEIANAVIEAYNAHRVDGIFIDYSGGLGAGVCDELKARGYYATEVHFSGKPRSNRFKNSRAEMWHEMARWLQSAEIPYIPGMKSEFCAPKYFYNKDDHLLQIESKDDMKKRGMHSPDGPDAIALTFYSPVAPRNEFGPVQKPEFSKDEWSPFGDE